MKLNILKEIKSTLQEVTAVNYKGEKYVLKIDVNEDPNKKGIKIQFIPTDYSSELSKDQTKVAMELQTRLNQALAPIGLSVERDRQLKDKSVIGFFVFLEYLEKVIVDKLK